MADIPFPVAAAIESRNTDICAILGMYVEFEDTLSISRQGCQFEIRNINHESIRVVQEAFNVDYPIPIGRPSINNESLHFTINDPRGCLLVVDIVTKFKSLTSKKRYLLTQWRGGVHALHALINMGNDEKEQRKELVNSFYGLIDSVENTLRQDSKSANRRHSSKR